MLCVTDEVGKIIRNGLAQVCKGLCLQLLEKHSKDVNNQLLATAGVQPVDHNIIFKGRQEVFILLQKPTLEGNFSTQCF